MSTAPTTQRPALGAPAPEFTLPDLAGRPIRLRDFRGRRVIVFMWSSW